MGHLCFRSYTERHQKLNNKPEILFINNYSKFINSKSKFISHYSILTIEHKWILSSIYDTNHNCIVNFQESENLENIYNQNTYTKMEYVLLTKKINNKSYFIKVYKNGNIITEKIIKKYSNKLINTFRYNSGWKRFGLRYKSNLYNYTDIEKLETLYSNILNR